MATRSSTNVKMAVSTDALFRVLAQFIEDTLVTTGGWVVTADTGQTAPAALVAPTTTSQKRGYRIYRMADALQATVPVFLRIDYGSGAAASRLGLWFTIGTGSDGAGTITSQRYATGATPLQPNTDNSATNTNCYGSADTSRFSIALGVNASDLSALVFTLERTKDSSGANTGDGLLFTFHGQGSVTVDQNFLNRYINLAAIGQPAGELYDTYVLTSTNPTAFGSNVGIALALHFAGTVVQPGPNLAVVKSNDFTAEATFSMTVYGASRTYQHTRNVRPLSNNNGVGVLDTTAVLCIRYD